MKPGQFVKPEAFSGGKNQLPHPSEIPNIDFEVTNLHVPLLGTLYTKSMVVGRKVAVIESNNTEDNDNVEMMTHLQGTIVDSIYETALITWGLSLHPPLSSANTPANARGLHADRQQEPLFMNRGQSRELHDVFRDGEAAQLPEHMPYDPHYDDDLASEIARMQSTYSPKSGESRFEATNRRLNMACKEPVGSSAPAIADGDHFTPYIPASTSTPFPITFVSCPHFGAPINHNVFVPQNEAWLSCIRNAKRNILIQTPDLNATHLEEATIAALKRGVQITYYVCFGYNDAGKLMPGQGGTNEMFATKLVEACSPQERDRLGS